MTEAALEVTADRLVQHWQLDTGGSVEDATEQIMQDLRPLQDGAEVHSLTRALRDAKVRLAERTRERDDAHRDLSIVYGRNECGQQFPSQRALVAAARRVARRNGWADPYPETTEEPKP